VLTTNLLVLIGNCRQHWGVRPRSYDKTCFRPALAWVLSWSLYSWSYTLGLASNTAVPVKTLSDVIMLKCVTSTCVISCNKYAQKQRKECQTLLVVTFWRFFFAPSYFLITNMRVATEEFFLLCINLLVLVLTFWSCFRH